MFVCCVLVARKSPDIHRLDKAYCGSLPRHLWRLAHCLSGGEETKALCERGSRPCHCDAARCSELSVSAARILYVKIARSSIALNIAFGLRAALSEVNAHHESRLPGQSAPRPPPPTTTHHIGLRDTILFRVPVSSQGIYIVFIAERIALKAFPDPALDPLAGNSMCSPTRFTVLHPETAMFCKLGHVDALQYNDQCLRSLVPYAWFGPPSSRRIVSMLPSTCVTRNLE